MNYKCRKSLSRFVKRRFVTFIKLLVDHSYVHGQINSGKHCVAPLKLWYKVRSYSPYYHSKINYLSGENYIRGYITATVTINTAAGH